MHVRDEADRRQVLRCGVCLQCRDRGNRVGLGAVEIDDRERGLELTRIGQDLVERLRELDLDADMLCHRTDLRPEQKVIDRREYRHGSIISEVRGPRSEVRGPRSEAGFMLTWLPPSGGR